MIDNTYLHIFPKLFQEHFLILLINVDLLSVIDEIIVLVGGQLLGLVLEIRNPINNTKLNSLT